MPNRRSLAEASRQIRSGRVKPSELVEECLARIGLHDDRLRAWVLVDEANARRTARKRDKELADGNCRGPLHGIPLGIKDIVDIEGLPTRAGSPLRVSHVARVDAPLVSALRRAGAVLLGKTVTCQFACFDPSPTRNPWGPELRHTPGGSSSGSAVAVAAGFCLGAIGTQTGGSLVRPASYCGVAAMKPTYGRICTDGIVAVSHHLDHPGPIARCAEDLALMAGCLLDGEAPAPRVGSETRKLGLVEPFFMQQADPSIRSVVQRAVSKWADSGAAVEPAGLAAGFDEACRMHRTIMAVEAAAVHRQPFLDHREAYAPNVAALIEEGLAVSAVDYAEALGHQRAFHAWADECSGPFDALVMPATESTAPASLETTGSTRFQVPWSYAGLPVVSIPCGLVGGMPAAVQLVGRRGNDMRLLETASWCEAQLDFRPTPDLG